MNDKKFSGQYFLIKLTSTAMWAWIVSCIMTLLFGLLKPDASWMNNQIIGNIIITVLFIGGKILIDAIAAFVSKGNLNVNVGR